MTVGARSARPRWTRRQFLVASSVGVAVALGVVPVGVTRGSSFQDGLAPWVVERLGPERPALFGAEQTNFEQIAGLRPDLILATDSYTLTDDYGSLSAIAPTLSYKTAVGSETWQQMATHIAPALGRTREAAGLVAEVETQNTDARSRHPELHGKTYTLGPFLPDNTIQAVSSTQDASAAILAQLGMDAALALGFPSVLSIPYVLSHTVPPITAALAG